MWGPIRGTDPRTDDEGTDLKTGKAYLNKAFTPTTTSGDRRPPIEHDQRPRSKGDRP